MKYPGIFSKLNYIRHSCMSPFHTDTPLIRGSRGLIFLPTEVNTLILVKTRCDDSTDVKHKLMDHFLFLRLEWSHSTDL